MKLKRKKTILALHSNRDSKFHDFPVIAIFIIHEYWNPDSFQQKQGINNIYRQDSSYLTYLFPMHPFSTP